MMAPPGPCSTERQAPPTFRSISETANDQPRGPNQRLNSSGLVKASKTRRRGASKTRVITTSRSVGIVTFNVPVFFTGDLLYCFLRLSFFYLSGVSAYGQLHEADFAANPRLRHRQRDEREWIPMGPEGRSLVPCRNGAHDAHDETQETAHQGVLHGPVGREPRDDVAGRHAVDRAIDRCKQEGPVEADH